MILSPRVLPIVNVTLLNAAGTVQFQDGTINLGIPVTVIAGVAIGPLSPLKPGSHSLTAVFTPTSPTQFQRSTSNTITVSL
jgi:hypothetical protein